MFSMHSKIFRSTVSWILFSLVISIAIYWKWFFTNEIYAWGDWGFLYRETMQEWLSMPQIWSNASLGSVDIGLSMYLPVKFGFGSLAQLGLDNIWVNKIVFFLPSIIVPTVSMFLLVKQVTKNNFAALVGSIVYNFNTYILTINTGHMTLGMAYAIGPFVFLLFKKAITEKSFFYSILAALVGSMASAYEVRAFYLIAWILFFYTLFIIIPLFLQKKYFETIKVGLYAGMPILLIGLMNTYWLLGFTKTISDFSGVAINRPIFGGTNLIINTVLTLFHPSWTGNHNIVWGGGQTIPFYFWLIPLFALSGFWINRKNTDIIFWMFIGLIGIFLTKSGGEPFPRIYEWLYNYLPGFNAFRESSKFTYYVVLSYAVLIGIFVSWILKKNIRVLFKYSIVIIIIGLFLLNTIHVIKGDLGRLLTPRHIPKDYLILKDFIILQKDFFRTLYLPADSKWGYSDYQHSKLNTRLEVQSEWKKMNDYKKTGLEYTDLGETTNIFSKDFSNLFLDYNSIKYVIVPIEDKENEEIFIFPNNAGPNDYIHFLDKIPFLKRIDIGTSKLAIYENEGYKNQFSSDKPFKVIKRSLTEYELIIDTKDKLDLHMSQNYNYGWKVRIGEFSWVDSLVREDYFLPDSLHNKTEYNLNVFHLPASSREGYKITIYFAPQAYVNVGVIISSSIFVLILGALCLTWKRR